MQSNIAFFSAVLYVNVGCFANDFRSKNYTPKFRLDLGLASQIYITAAQEYRVVSEIRHKTDV